MLSVEGLRSGYNRIPILHGIDLRVDAGQFVGTLGHNGMGKTTLLKTIIGIVPATAGRIASRFQSSLCFPSSTAWSAK